MTIVDLSFILNLLNTLNKNSDLVSNETPLKNDQTFEFLELELI